MTPRRLARILADDRTRTRDALPARYVDPVGDRGRHQVEVDGVRVEATSEAGLTWPSGETVLVAKPGGRDYVIVGPPPPGKAGAFAQPILGGSSKRFIPVEVPPPGPDLTPVVGDWPPSGLIAAAPYSGASVSVAGIALPAPSVMTGEPTEAFIEVVTATGVRSTECELLRNPDQLGRPEWQLGQCPLDPFFNKHNCWVGGLWIWNQFGADLSSHFATTVVAGQPPRNLQLIVANLLRTVEASPLGDVEVLPEVTVHLRVRSVGGEVILSDLVTITRSVYLLDEGGIQ